MSMKTLSSFASGRRWSACLSAHSHELVQPCVQHGTTSFALQVQGCSHPQAINQSTVSQSINHATTSTTVCDVVFLTSRNHQGTIVTCRVAHLCAYRDNHVGRRKFRSCCRLCIAPTNFSCLFAHLDAMSSSESVPTSAQIASAFAVIRAALDNEIGVDIHMGEWTPLQRRSLAMATQTAVQSYSDAQASAAASRRQSRTGVADPPVSSAASTTSTQPARKPPTAAQLPPTAMLALTRGKPPPRRSGAGLGLRRRPTLKRPPA